MGHPREHHYDAQREADERRYLRLRKMRERLARTPVWSLGLTADYLYDICVVMNPQIAGYYRQNDAADQALDRLED